MIKRSEHANTDPRARADIPRYRLNAGQCGAQAARRIQRLDGVVQIPATILAYDATKEEWYTMRWGDLEEPAEKLRWAAEQYRLIKNEMGGADHQAVPLEVEGSLDGLRYDMYVGSVPPLPDHLPLRIGDIYHNLRGALDYLAYQLHERHYRGNIPSQVVKDSQFPIFGSVPTGKSGTPLATNSWKAMRTLGVKERTAISWLQPYNTRKDKLEGIRNHLRDIGNINNIDKHRNLHITRSMVQAVRSMASIPDYRLTQDPAFGAVIEVGTRIDTWIFERRPPVATMAGQFTCRAGAVFEASGDRFDALPHIAGSIASVRKVIERFAPLFSPLPSGSLVFPWVRVTEPLGS